MRCALSACSVCWTALDMDARLEFCESIVPICDKGIVCVGRVALRQDTSYFTVQHSCTSPDIFDPDSVLDPFCFFGDVSSRPPSSTPLQASFILSHLGIYDCFATKLLQPLNQTLLLPDPAVRSKAVFFWFVDLFPIAGSTIIDGFPVSFPLAVDFDRWMGGG